ncbi:MAG: photosynthetic reaction center subunit H [Nannocystaceae bacterium]
MPTEITASIDTAQVVLYFFWIFFAGLIVWIRREDRREGYPLEHETLAIVNNRDDIRLPQPKEFLLPHGEGIRKAPDYERDTRDIKAERTSPAVGYPLEPTGEAILSEVGPASYAERSDHPELSHEDDRPTVLPMRVAEGFSVSAGPDPRGWEVHGSDGAVAGKVTDIWVDRADLLIRYLEVELRDDLVADEPQGEPEAAAEAAQSEGDSEGDGDESASADEPAAAPAAKAKPKSRLLPIQMLSLNGRTEAVQVRALRAEHFAHVPTLKDPDQVTLLEEEKVSAFYAGGWFYSEAERRESVL